MTPLVDNVSDIAARLKAIEDAKEKVRNTPAPAQEKTQEIENHEWSFSVDNLPYPG